jgi:ribose transport system ATP-binding protein
VTPRDQRAASPHPPDPGRPRADAPDGKATVVECSGLSKSFGGVRALDDASLSASVGEVHALVGENGAGKSTLIKVLGGRLRPDSGSIRVNGTPVTLAAPPDAHRLGIWTVFQELTLLPWLSVAENLLIRREPRGRTGLIDRRGTERRAAAILAGFGIEHIDPLALIEDLSLAARQIVEIVRAISHDPAVLLLDEPTSSLVEREVVWLFGQIRRLRGRGTCVIFTSHRWNEIRDIADRITVFRGGRHVGTFREIDQSDAVVLMTGRRVEALYPPLPPLPPPLPPLPPLPPPLPALEARAVAGRGVGGVSFTLHTGEVLGVGGLAGHGHRELFLLLFGAQRMTAGTLLAHGQTVRLHSPRDAVRRAVGLALVPEDRKTEGLLLAMSIRDNLTLSILRWITRFGVLRKPRERRLAQDMAARLRVRMPGLNAPVGALSGGNQQKVLIGRWLLAEPQVLLLYDVTRGVDVATKHELYELVMQLAASGHAILLYSSDAEELAHLSHRVLVMREGRLAAEMAAPGITAEAIVAAAVRDTAESAALIKVAAP